MAKRKMKKKHARSSVQAYGSFDRQLAKMFKRFMLRFKLAA